MKPTIRDVAKHAGVSVATVSRYLNNSPLIAEASIEKVKRSIELLNFQPNMMARGLLHGNTRTVALAVDDSDVEIYGNDYFLHIQYGLEHELAQNGYYLMICHIGTGKISPLEAIVKENRIDGMVLLSELARPHILDFLKKSELPYVIVGRSKDRESLWVDIDNIEAGRCATEYVLKRGIKKIGFLANSFQKIFVKERYEGFKQEIEKTENKNITFTVTDGMLTAEAVSSYVNACNNEYCDAYVASDSTIAFYLLRELNKKGVQIPNEVQVIGFDDSILAKVSEPTMSVVKIDVTNLGMSVAKLLIKQLQGEQSVSNQLLLPVSIVERGSVKK